MSKRLTSSHGEGHSSLDIAPGALKRFPRLQLFLVASENKPQPLLKNYLKSARVSAARLMNPKKASPAPGSQRTAPTLCSGAAGIVVAYLQQHLPQTSTRQK
jgi:hypothetical protein